MKKILFLCCSLAISTSLKAGPAKQILVGPEDTVYSIAYNNGIPTRTLIAANALRPPYILTPGQVIVIPSPGEHIVGAGESLQTIAEEYGVKVDVLAQENQIRSPYFVRQGDVLSIPSHDTESFAEALTPEAPAIVTSSLAPLPSVKTAPLTGAPLELAETGADPAISDELAAELAREKGTPLPQKPMLMGNLTQKNQGASIGGDVPAEEEVQKKPKKPVKKQEQKVVKEKKVIKKEEPEEEASPAEEESEDETPIKEEKTKKTAPAESAPKAVAFVWPLEGKVISKFNPGKNDGVNIEVPEGTSVKAAAAGEVMYAGNELKGFGNLLLIKHKDGWTTVYAHLSETLVKKGVTVKQGQTIAKSGSSGDAKVPQLHFEIRMVKKAVDPLSKLES